MHSRLVTPPVQTPISLAEAKAHLRIDHDDQDDLVLALIAAATDHLQEVTGRPFVTQTWEMALDAFPAREIPINRLPVQSVESIKYDDPDGFEQTVSPLEYELDDLSAPAWIYRVGSSAWPSALEAVNAVRVRFVAGYGDPEAVPAALRHAVKLLVGQWFAMPEAASDKGVTEIPFGVMALISPYRTLF